MVDVGDKILPNGNLKLTISFDDDDERKELLELAKESYLDAEQEIAEAFFPNTGFRFVEDYDQMVCGDLTDMVGLTTNDLAENYPDSNKILRKLVDKGIIRWIGDYDHDNENEKFDCMNMWFYNKLDNWMEDLIEHGEVVFESRENLTGGKEPRKKK